jgi:hypothetical protein
MNDLCVIMNFVHYNDLRGARLGSAHNSSRGNLLAQKRACCVENARKVFNLAVLFALQPRFCAQNG